MAMILHPKAVAEFHGLLKRIPASRSTMPILSMFHLQAEGGKLTATATDLDVMISVIVEAEGTLPALYLPGHLLACAASMTGQSVAFTPDDSGHTLAVTAGRARYASGVLPGADMPMMQGDMDSHAMIKGSDLARLIGDCLLAVSTEETRFYLNGVFLGSHDGDGDAPKLHAVGLDGHRMVTRRLPMPEGLSMESLTAHGGGRGIIIPTKAARLIADMAAKAGDERVKLSLSATKVALECGATRLVSKVIDGSFPDWSRVLPRPCDHSITVDVEEAHQAAARIISTAQAATAGVTNKGAKAGGNAVKLSAGAEWLAINYRRHAETAEDGAPAEVQGTPPDTGVSILFLEKFLSLFKAAGADTMTLMISDPGAPIRIENPADERITCVVMPMRL